jgi:hypothetical protein
MAATRRNVRKPGTPVTLEEALAQLEALGDAKVRAQNKKGGVGDNQFGVSLGDIRGLAKKIRTDHALARPPR